MRYLLSLFCFVCFFHAVPLRALKVREISKIALNAKPIKLAIEEDTGHLYILDHENDELLIYEDKALLRQIPVGPYPSDMVVSSKLNTIFVANAGNNTISVIDIPNGTERQIEVEEGNKFLVLDEDEEKLFVVCEEEIGTLRIISTDTLATLGLVEIGLKPFAMVYCPDQKTLGIGFSSRKSLLWADCDGNTLGSFDALAYPTAIALSIDKKTLFFARTCNRKILAIDIASGEVPSELPVLNSPHFLLPLPGGKMLLAANKNSTSIHFINIASRRIAGELKLNFWPGAVAFNSRLNLLYIADYKGKEISIFRVKTHAPKTLCQPRSVTGRFGVYEGSQGRSASEYSLGSEDLSIASESTDTMNNLPTPISWGHPSNLLARGFLACIGFLAGICE